MNTSLSTAVTQEDNRFSRFMLGEVVKHKINDMMGSKKGEGFITSIISAVSKNPSLSECDHRTILSAGMEGAALDLAPSPVLGYFYMVPYNDNKNNRKVAQFQIGYKGYIQLAIRSGQYRRINVVALKDGELVSYNRLTEELFTKLIDDDEIRERTPTIGYYAMFELTNGFIKSMYWSKSKMEQHADRYSQAFNLATFRKIESGAIPKEQLWKREYSSFWYQDFENMAFKTMLRQLLSKWGVMSIEMQRAFDVDMAVIDQNGNASYIDNGDAIMGSEDQSEGEEKTLPAYTDAQLENNLSAWQKVIDSGKTNAEGIIAKVTSGYRLTPEQTDRIRALKQWQPSEEELAAIQAREMEESRQGDQQ